MTDVLQDIDNWLKEAAVKDAHEMGSQDTSHPSAKADDQDEPAQTGSRASENESDVKAGVPGQSVDEASGSEAEGPGRGENAPSTEIGTKAAPTGEDAANETSSARSGRPDPGTSHPANTDYGEKYSQLLTMGDEGLADIATAQSAGDLGEKDEKGEKDTEKAAEGDAECPEKDKDKKDKDKGDMKYPEKGKMPPQLAAAKKKEAEAKSESEKPESESEKPEAEKEAGEKSEGEQATDEEAQAKQAGAETADAVIDALDLANQPEMSPQQIVEAFAKQGAVCGDMASDYLDGYLRKGAQGEEQLEESSDNEVEEAPEVEGAGPEVEGAGEEAAVEGEGGALDIKSLIEALMAQGVTPEDLLAGGGGEEEAAAAVPAEGMVPPVDEEAALAAAAAPKMAEWNGLSHEDKVARMTEALVRASGTSK
jgi:hypothetical protein